MAGCPQEEFTRCISKRTVSSWSRAIEIGRSISPQDPKSLVWLAWGPFRKAFSHAEALSYAGRFLTQNKSGKRGRALLEQDKPTKVGSQNVIPSPNGNPSQNGNPCQNGNPSQKEVDSVYQKVVDSVYQKEIVSDKETPEKWNELTAQLLDIFIMHIGNNAANGIDGPSIAITSSSEIAKRHADFYQCSCDMLNYTCYRRSRCETISDLLNGELIDAVVESNIPLILAILALPPSVGIHVDIPPSGYERTAFHVGLIPPRLPMKILIKLIDRSATLASYVTPGGRLQPFLSR